MRTRHAAARASRGCFPPPTPRPLPALPPPPGDTSSASLLLLPQSMLALQLLSLLLPSLLLPPLLPPQSMLAQLLALPSLLLPPRSLLLQAPMLGVRAPSLPPLALAPPSFSQVLLAVLLSSQLPSAAASTSSGVSLRPAWGTDRSTHSAATCPSPGESNARP